MNTTQVDKKESISRKIVNFINNITKIVLPVLFVFFGVSVLYLLKETNYLAHDIKKNPLNNIVKDIFVWSSVLIVITLIPHLIILIVYLLVLYFNSVIGFFRELANLFK